MRRALILLAAGKGERLRPLTETRPKPLMPVLGETALCRHIRIATQYYKPDVVVVVASYMKDKVWEEASRCSPVDVLKVDQGGELGTGHAVLAAMNASEADDYMIVYSDVVASREVYEAIASAKPPAILAWPVDRPWEYGVLALRDGSLAGIVEKPPPGREPSRLIFAGMMRLESSHKPFFERLDLSPRGEYEATQALSIIAGREEVAVVEPETGFWLDIGRPWDLLEANRIVMERELEPGVQGEVHSTSVVDGRVWIGEGAVVKPFTVIEGPAYIGPGAVVGPHAYVRSFTVMLAGSKAGHSTEVKASIFMEHAKAPHLSYVGDSILGEHVNLGAGTVTANLRFDHKTIKVTIKDRRVDSGRRKLGAIIGGYAQTGINVSILPGVKIGSYALVYPGCTVTRDVESRGVYKCGTAPT